MLRTRRPIPGRPRPAPRPRPGRRPGVERLEDRLLLDVARDLGPLRLVAPAFSQNGTVYTASNSVVTIGYTPAGGEDLHALVQVDLTGGTPGTLSFDPTAAPATFTVTGGTLRSVVQGGLPVPLWRTPDATTAVPFNVAQLTSPAGLALANGLPFTVARVSFTATKLLFANPDGDGTADTEVKLQGGLALPKLPNWDLSVMQPVVDGTNFVLLQNSGISLTGARLAFSDPTQDLGGLKGVGLSLSLGYSGAGGHDTFTVQGGLQISSQPQDTSGEAAFRDVGASLLLSFQDGDVTQLGFTLTAGFNLFGLDVDTLPGRPLQFDYNFQTEQYEITGGLKATFPDAARSNAELKLGAPGDPGIILRGGVLTKLNATIDGTLSLAGAKLTTAGQGLNFLYDRGREQFEMYGGLTLLIPSAGGSTTQLAAQMGDAASPGLILQGGQLHQINVALSGQFDLFGLTLAVQTAGLTYSKTPDGHDEFDLFGTLTVKQLWQASVSVGSQGRPGIVIRDGHFALDGLTLALANVNLGAFQVQNFVVAYTAGAAADFTLAVTLALVFPGGWAVGGSVTLDSGRVADIDVFFAATSGNGIPVGDTGLYLQYIDASVQNLTDPSNVVVSGEVDFAFGDTFSLLGHDLSVFTASGSFYVTKDELVLQAHSYAGSYQVGTGVNNRPLYRGLLGEGDGTLTLDWGQKDYSLTASWSYLDGTFELQGALAFNNSGDLVLGGRASVNVPHEVPFIGGDTIGDVDFLFEFHPHDLGHSFFAAWTRVHVLFVHVDIGFRFGLDKHFSVIGGSTIDAYEDCLSNPEKCLDGQGTFTYFSSYQVPGGATAVTLSVAWPSPGGTRGVSVTLPDGTVVQQGDFAKHNITVVSQLSSGTKTTVSVVGDPNNPDIPLPAGSYTLTLTSSTKYDHGQVVFTSLSTFPAPTVAVGSPLPPPGPDCVIPVTLSGTVDRAFKDQTRVTLYADTGNDPDHRRGVPVAGATGLTVTPDVNGHWSLAASWDISRLVPGTTYYVYAVINDGTNTPAASAYSAAVLVDPELSGRVTDVAHGGTPVGGALVYLDLNHNGRYDPPAYDQNGTLTRPGEPVSFTTALGYYAFCDLTTGQPIDVGLVLPQGYQLDPTAPDNTNPRRGVVYDGTHPLTVSFALDKLAAISGRTYFDEDQDGHADPADPGLATWVVYLDTNGNGRQDPGETTAATDSAGNYTFFDLTPATTYTVRTTVPPGYYATAPAGGSYTVTLTSDPFEQVTGRDFGVLPYSSISGTVSGYGISGGRLGTGAGPRQGWTVRLLQPVLAVNAGGGSYGPYQADQGSQGGDTFYNSQAIDTSGVVGPAPLYVYQTLRHGPDFSYTVTGLTPGAGYLVRLHFADNYYTKAGQRVFDVAVNGQTLLSRYDIAGLAGGANKAIAAAVPATADAGGRLALHFTGVVGDALVNGLEVSRVVATTTTDDAGRYAFGGFARVAVAAGATAPVGPFLADRGYSGSSQVVAPVSQSVDTSQIADPAPAAVYQANRYGKDFTYTVSGLVPLADYDVRLHFAETYWTAPGQRVFDVAVNGQPALVHFDIVAAAGGAFVATAQTVSGQSAADGTLTLHFTADVDNAQVNGLEVRRTFPFGGNTGPAAAPAPPDRPPGLTAGVYSVLAELPSGWRQLAPFASAFALTTPSGGDLFPFYSLTPIEPVALQVGDFTGDGRPSIALLDGSPLVFPFTGVGPAWLFADGNLQTLFPQPAAFGVPHPHDGAYVMLVAGDFHGTGRPDLAILSNLGDVAVLKNQGAGAFTVDAPGPSVSGGLFTGGAVAGRFLGGGQQIAVLLQQPPPVYNFGLTVLSGTPTAPGPVTGLPAGYQVPLGWEGLMATADFNVDGQLDLLLANTAGSPLLAYGDGQGRFAVIPIDTLPAGHQAFAGDLNGDGLPDAGLFDTQGGLHYALQNTDATFTPGATDVVSPGPVLGAPLLADVDGDLRPDLVWLAQGPTGHVLAAALNTGQAGALFAAARQSTWALADTSQGPGALAAFGRNADGLPHLVAVSQLLTGSNTFGPGAVQIARNVTLLYPAAYALDPVGTDLVGQDFLAVQLGQVSGRAFDDPAADGVHRPAKAGRAGVTVFVDLDRDGRPDPGEPLAVTGPDGVYAFDGLAPGRYSVRMLPEAGRKITTPAGVAHEAAVGAGPPVTGLDFGTAAARDVTWAPPPATAPGEWTVVRNGDRLELFDSMMGTVASEPLAELASVTVAEPAGGGRLTVDLAGGGFFRLEGGLHIAAGRGAADGLRFLLGPGDNRVSIRDGRADIDAGLVVTWSGVRGAAVLTGGGADRVSVQPGAVAVDVDAGPGGAGDRLTVEGMGGSPRLTVTGPGAGVWTFTDAAPVSFRGVADLAPGDYVWTLYRDVLGRAPDAEGHAHWRAALDGGLSREGLAAIFWNSAEHRALQVAGFYRQYLHRAADAEGLAAWVAALQGGLGETAVAAAFLASDEYRQRHGGGAAFVAALYRDVLGREPDAAGLAAWQEGLDGGRAPQAVAAAILGSPEGRAVLVDEFYRDYLGRPADAAGRAFWVEALVSGRTTPAGLGEALLASDELFAGTVQ